MSSRKDRHRILFKNTLVVLESLLFHMIFMLPFQVPYPSPAPTKPNTQESSFSRQTAWEMDCLHQHATWSLEQKPYKLSIVRIPYESKGFIYFLMHFPVSSCSHLSCFSLHTFSNEML